MGQIIYEIINGVPNFIVSLIPNVVPDQIQSSLGIYYFDDIPDGFYSLIITDAQYCRRVLQVEVNMDPCRLEGVIQCEMYCTLEGIVECLPDITTTTTSTTEGICQTCPPDYIGVIGSCYKEIIISPAAPITPQYLYAKSNIRYGTIGTIVFAEGWNYNGYGSVYNVYTTGSFWRNPLITSIYGSTTDGVMNKNAVWSGVTLDYQTVGFPICFDIVTEKTYLIGMACDNYAEIKIDGISVLYQDPTALYTLYTDNGWSIPSPLESTFRAWYIYPIRLGAGKHIIELIGHNNIDVAAVGLDIYDMTEAELMACNSYADIGAGLLFSTKNEVGHLVKIGNEGQGYTCPEGYILGYCDLSPMCYKIDYVPCGTIITTTPTTTSGIVTTTTTVTTECTRPLDVISGNLLYYVTNVEEVGYESYLSLELTCQGITDYLASSDGYSEIVQFVSPTVGQIVYYDTSTDCGLMYDGYFCLMSTIHDISPVILHIVDGIINEILNCSISKCYGLFYNWPAAAYVGSGTDSLAPLGFHIPADTEWEELGTTLGGLTVAGAKMKEVGTVNWIAPNTGATNSSGFTALPAGNRDWSGTFVNQNYYAVWWSSSETVPGAGKDYHVEVNYNYLGWTGQDPRNGFALRAVKDDNIWPTEPIYDYDGNLYTPIQIGSQIWLKENLITTHSREGGLSLLNVYSVTEWSSLTVPGVCAYENNWIGNACVTESCRYAVSQMGALDMSYTTSMTLGNTTNVILESTDLVGQSIVRWFIVSPLNEAGFYITDINALQNDIPLITGYFSYIVYPEIVLGCQYAGYFIDIEVLPI